MKIVSISAVMELGSGAATVYGVSEDGTLCYWNNKESKWNYC